MRIPKPTADPRNVPWVVTALLGVLMIVVPVLAWLQYEWTGEASRAEVFRMRSNLRTTLMHWSQEFEATTALTQDLGPPPEVRGQTLNESQALDLATQILASRELGPWPGLYRSAWVTTDSGTWLPVPGGWMKVVDGTWGETAPSVSTALTRNPNRRLVQRLDQQTLLQDIVAPLVAKYFSGAEGLPGYTLGVVDVATGEILWSSDGKPELLATRGEPETGLSLLGGRGGPIPIDAAGTMGSVTQSPFGDLLVTMRTFRVSDRTNWVLQAWHVDGSVEAAAERIRWLNLAGSFTVLAILTVAFLILYGLYNRNRLAVRAQQDFVSSVSHELKTPLAVLRAAAENLKEGVVSEPSQAQRYGERMLSEADRLLVLTDNILRYAGLERQTWSLDGQDPFELGPVVEARGAAWQEAYQQKGVELNVDAAKVPVLIRGREADLAAVVDNLLSNALKHGTSGAQPSRVTLSWGQQTEKAPHAWFAVQDNGKGLAPREQRKIFEPFYRPPGTTVSGVGLGLSLVARMAAAHGGRVEVKSAPGAGARFTVFLPLFHPPKAAL